MAVPILDLSEKYVAPFAGAWIEMVEYIESICIGSVAPFAGAWIEIKARGKAVATW